MTRKKRGDPTRRIAILTAGGDCPGLNAVIRAVVRTAEGVHGWDVYGVRNGFEGFLESPRRGLRRLTREDVTGILRRGGTILGASNRCDLFQVPQRSGPPKDMSHRVPEALSALGISALIVVGGDGSHKQAADLQEIGVRVVGVPKTIDNDLNGTDVTFGFDTATGVISDAVDRLHTTAESHHRVMCIEVMGRHAGFLALHGGMSGGADVILIPEIPYDPDMIARKVSSRARHGRTFSLVVVSEGAHRPGREATYREGAGRDPINDRLGGVSYAVAADIRERIPHEVRNIVLGHLQRGGSPTPFDRVLATRLGAHAVDLVASDRYGRMAALKGTRVTDVTIRTAVSRARRVSPKGDLVRAAREIGISFAAADGSDEPYAKLRTKHGVP